MKVFTAQDVARTLKLSYDVVLELIHSGQLKAKRCVGRAGARGTWRITEKALEEYMDAESPTRHSTKAPAPWPQAASLPRVKPAAIAPTEPLWDFTRGRA